MEHLPQGDALHAAPPPSEAVGREVEALRAILGQPPATVRDGERALPLPPRLDAPKVPPPDESLGAP